LVEGSQGNGGTDPASVLRLLNEFEMFDVTDGDQHWIVHALQFHLHTYTARRIESLGHFIFG